MIFPAAYLSSNLSETAFILGCPKSAQTSPQLIDIGTEIYSNSPHETSLNNSNEMISTVFESFTLNKANICDLK
jgi:hypothetical protein